ncbi:HAMP domain-containing histidine kinase [Actinomadura darangshiensis]|uniref:Sensor-like histidine kinase SenX3 n=1 Tax=Actinomadura darangshiensis TaxID=705336 RepID=A0A4R5BM64_9ACTN|nr:HAMP domain-containing sensor histidine kinase [Actinomadura darangshiensis]TDD86985.1 HAMP domain-containing histidine kinase [Actinomadura darangshiensis]
MSRARGRAAVQAAGAAIVLPAALGAIAYRAAASGMDATARRRLRWALAAAGAAHLPAALLSGHLIARRRLAPLDEALDRRRRFAAEVTHELRAPIARLHTRAQLAARGLRAGADVAGEMDLLVADTARLGEVVDDVLRSARLDRPRSGAGPVDLAALASELAASELVRAGERGVTIAVSRQGPRHVVHGAEPALRRLLSALVDNALAHTGRGGHIWVTLSGTPAKVEVTVRDDGDGLDPEDAGRLFAGHSRDGLGLALAREVVDGHGGTITAAGRPGAGAAFTVRLPAASR